MDKLFKDTGSILQRIVAVLRVWVFAPYVLAVQPVLLLYAINFETISPADIIAPILGAILVAG